MGRPCAGLGLAIHRLPSDEQRIRRQYLFAPIGICLLNSCNFRVEPSVAGWLPHSPVRAQLRHTVLQARISLRRQSGPPSRVESGKTA